MLPESIKRISLHLQVGGDVPSGGGHTRMAEIVADHGDVGARLEKRHSATVAQYMRSNPLSRKHGAILGRR